MSSSHRRLTLILLVVLVGPGTAQTVVPPGDIGVTNLNPNTFYTLNPATALMTPYNVGSFGGGSARTILWDPNATDSFIIGGQDFIGRVTVTAAPSPGAPGAATYTLFTNLNAGRCHQMAWDSQFNLLFSDSITDQIGFLDLTTNTVTYITTGMQPWNSALQGLAYDAMTGTLYAGGDGMVYRLTRTSPIGVVPPTFGAPTPFANLGCTNTNGCPVTSLTFDPSNANLYATVYNSRQVLLLTQNVTGAFTGMTNLTAPSLLRAPRASCLDNNGDLVVGSSANLLGGNVIRLALASPPPITPVLLGTTSWSANCGGNTCPVNGVAVVGGNPFSLTATGGGSTPTSSNLTTIDILNLPTGTTEGWTLASLTLPAVPGGGWFAGLQPDMLTVTLFQSNPTTACGFPLPVHWSTACSTFPYPFTTVSPFPPGTQTDLVAIAITANGFTATPVVRHTW